jgi:hypothetical protein
MNISLLPGTTSPAGLPDLEKLSETHLPGAQGLRINCRDYVASRTSMYSDRIGQDEEAAKVGLSGMTEVKQTKKTAV